MAVHAHPAVASAPPQADAESIEHGLSIDRMLGFLSATGLDLKDIYDVVIPARTLTRRCDRNEKLSPTESEKLARLIRVYDHTLRVFGTAEKTLYFLRQPKQSFDGRTPLDLVCTESGAELVEGMLWQIEDGVFV